MVNINRMVAQWDYLIDIANTTASFNSESEHLMRNMFNKVVMSAQKDGNKLDASELLSMIEAVTDNLLMTEKPELFCGQLMLLTTLLAIYYPATMGLCSKGYECAAKTLQAERVISPN